ncbi:MULTISPECIES: thioesterase II family protein [Dactylosporangium]|uniref:Thioesterase n=2 Tax=Dactylosporangium TaxID=35753 RepID=A0A9W6KP61_9ACTN|nr:MULTISPECIES: alpha/beta fold hydrolase [Dactylosporangium]UAB97657.1 thioesterase [Dactylosporangium vinaceum]UWZ45901.1 thioesterase [Dactylosporangium matsuzakiense]GLL02934.1 thioesterase [Dactylosporangium matsuzakiense]
MAGPWLVAWHPRPAERPLLVCLPPAGAGCVQFRAWQHALGDAVAVAGVQLPGRETRWSDPPAESMDAAVAAIAAEVAALVPADHPIVVFGHSFGALIGWELVRTLRRERGQRVEALVVAACKPPDRWVGAGRGLVEDDDELATLLDTRGLGADDLDEDTRELMLAVLRHDARLSMSFTGAGLAPLDVPLEAWVAEADPTVPPADMTDWRRYAGAGFTARRFPGGHYFCLDDPAPVLPILAARARDAVATKGTIG